MSFTQIEIYCKLTNASGYDIDMDWNDIVKRVQRPSGTKWGDEEEDANIEIEAEKHANSKATEGQVEAEKYANSKATEGQIEAKAHTKAETKIKSYGISAKLHANIARSSRSASAEPVKYNVEHEHEPKPTKSFGFCVEALAWDSKEVSEISSNKNNKVDVDVKNEVRVKVSYADIVKVKADVEPSAKSEVVLKLDTATDKIDIDKDESYKIIGDRIGLQSAQSVMMLATQNNLSHFHTAGMVNLQYSVHAPSAAEAMDFIYNQNNTGMKFTSSSLSERQLRKYLVGANLGSFVLTVGSSFTDLPDRENIWYEALGKKIDKNTVLRIYIDYNKMYDHGLTLYDLAHESFGEDCVWHVSPDFMGMIDVVVGDTLMSQWLSRMKTKVCGKFSILSCNRTLELENCFATTGTDMLAVCRIPGVDKRTVEMNNVLQVERHLGIEAAANVLYKLIGNSAPGGHSKGKIISDFMARTGNILPFSKRSSEIRYKGVLTSMGFERPKDDIKREITNKFKLHSDTQERSAAKSVYEYIMNGKDIPVGFDVVL